ncbi:MAG: S8 family serine peptidase [Bdellovibrionales bacterium]|nr:S8 family serine peptidase [Bdellovibrionales bacterium]
MLDRYRFRSCPSPIWKGLLLLQLLPNIVLALPLAVSSQFVIAPIRNQSNTTSHSLVSWQDFPEAGGPQSYLPSESRTDSIQFVDEESQRSRCDDLLRAYGHGIGEGWYCEPNFVVATNALPVDPLYSNQQSLSSIETTVAWDTTTGSRDITVAVLDTGIDYTHPDLAANMWRNPGEIPNNGIDDDENGFIDDVFGIDTSADSGDPMDNNGHGTHCAGIIGAVTNNATGISGIAWNVKLMALKFLGSGGTGNIFSALSAIDYAIENDVKIINASFGGGYPSVLLEQTIERANAAGITLVAAAGNDGIDIDSSPEYPAAFPLENIISVAASDEDENIAWFSNYGEHSVDIVAPGSDILSTIPGGYARYSGTSMAAPHVTGVAALVLSERPELTPGQLRDNLLRSGVRSTGYYGLVSSSSRLNARRAVEEIYEQTAPIPGVPKKPKDPTVTITKLKTTSADHKSIERGGRFRFSVRGTPLQSVDISFELLDQRRTITCSPWKTILNTQGVRRIVVRIPRDLPANKLTISTLQQSNLRELRIRGMRTKSKHRGLQQFLSPDTCEELIRRVRLR